MKKLFEELKKLQESSEDIVIDELFIRELIADEENAVRKYKDFASKTTDEKTKKVLLDIAKEEEVHIGELVTYLEIMLNKHNQSSKDTLKEGETEVKKTISEEDKKTKIHANNKEDLRPLKPGEYIGYGGGGFHIMKKEEKVNEEFYKNSELINLTPHDINFMNHEGKVIHTLPKSKSPSRKDINRERKDSIEFNGITMPINEISYGEDKNLPKEEKGKFYVVSSITAENNGGRNDLLVPNDVIRDDKGNPIGCKSLAYYSKSVSEEESVTAKSLKDFVQSFPTIEGLLQEYLNKFYTDTHPSQEEIANGEVRIGKEFSDIADIIVNSLRITKHTAILEMYKLILELQHDKNNAYHERDMLVALISKVFPSYLAKHDPTDESWDKEWTNIVYVNLPTGQCSWHIKDNELPLFNHLSYSENNWDGHTTVEKYIRISKYRMGINRAEHELSDILDEGMFPAGVEQALSKKGYNKDFKGCSLGKDKDGYFVYTHRARSKSYETPEKISEKDINYIDTTG